MRRMPPLAAALCAIAFSGQAQALPPLHENDRVVGGFYAIGLADEVRKNCDDISPRIFAAIGYLRSLENYALSQGYSRDDLKALKDNKAEKEALKTRIRSELESRGATPAQPGGYCDVGREEIARGSAAGKLLKAR
ncbi:hypothetical protein EKE94_14650 [Mesobaculum littorinae]|uniref:Uncharacterized protein n=1 Tax=Mesobaculum littorinae TaxID=2486419 RepID=A0A438AF02_9RHOB|nr:DUF5333 domain-containing protein [Mesobaculum littorinae]RVV97252.1 hypothetical protein EKE94_14650 [Mesobaculum littorinae]